MRRFGSVLAIAALGIAPAFARHTAALCGTSRERPRQTEFLHRQAVRRAGARVLPRAAGTGNRDIGEIAIVQDEGGVVARQNDFNLDGKRLIFTPDSASAAQYRYSVGDGGYDPAAASGATPLVALDDDDSREVALPFAFPFFGSSYSRVFVNSDGNLTFTAPDSASTIRSLGRAVSGPPRIAPLFDDLNPAATSGGVRVLASAGAVIVSWVAVPEWAPSGVGPAQTFQAVLFPDGTIEFRYSGVNPSAAVVGIAPGGLKGSTQLVDFRNDPSADYTAAVAERFGSSLEVDIVTAAETFYRTHDDAYDYLVIYNNMDIPAGAEGVVSYESTARTSGTGYGLEPMDSGAQYGSASRLAAVLNMGPLSEYPDDPNGVIAARAAAGDTPVTALAHETGHLFLAYASVSDPDDPTARPMLGYQNAHWSFAFNSEASLLEGERIADLGEDVHPRFLTTDTVQWYAPLDQYLMGFRAPEEVPDTFLVTGVPAALAQQHPIRNYPFDGGRRDIAASAVVQAMGRRTPDATVAQHRFRFAFVLVTAQGVTPPAADLAKLDAFRRQFEAFFGQASSGNASADTSLKRSMKLSLFPAAGVLEGGTVNAGLTVDTPPAADMDIRLSAPAGYAAVPASVRIPAGGRTADFAVTGVRAGVEEISAAASDAAYENAVARVQVADSSNLRLVAVSGANQIAGDGGALPEPVVVRVTDANRLVYAGVRIAASATAGGSIAPATLTTDAAGQASFRWTAGTGAVNELHLAVEAFPSTELTLTAGSAVPVIARVVNAASYADGMTPGGITTIFGANLLCGHAAADISVEVNGEAAPVLYAADAQVNFAVPGDIGLGPGSVSVAAAGTHASAAVSVLPVQPGIFSGAVFDGGVPVTAEAPAAAGDVISIYCTGLGPTGTGGRTLLTPVVFIGATPVQPVFSGVVAGSPGLYRIDVPVPGGLAPGAQPLILSVSLAHSNEVQIEVK